MSGILNKTILAGTLSVLFLLTGCSKPEGESAWFTISGYRTTLIYNDQFKQGISDWHLEGDGKAVLTEKNEIELLAYSGGNGLVLWAPIELSGSFQLEYEVDIRDSCGTNTVIFCAQDSNGEDILNTSQTRTGELSDYVTGSIRNYMITYNTLDNEGNKKNQSRLRKNPQYMMLSNSDNDPCIEGRHYLIDIVKMSNRIQFFVNGKLIHDIRDKGGFDAPVYMEGRLGFRIEPFDKDASILIYRVKLYQLDPI
jgi:hypothetical protein